jgi:iron complex outermembrane receptor protein
MQSKFALKPLSAVVALALAQWALPAFSQDSSEAQPDPNKVQSVVVTANKRVERLENVPMAISVISEQEIQRNNIREIEDVIALTPSLTQASGTTAANNALFMRGIGTVSVGIGVESDVAVIIDDIPIAVQFQAFRDLADVSRIEVLKGPQSTLFGKSAVAGALNIVTKPVSGPMTYRGSYYRTDDGEWRVAASAGGRLSDTFAMRLAANKNEMPGNFTNLTTGEKVNGSSGNTFMGKLSWTPIRNLDIDILPHYNKQENSRGVTAVNGFYRTTGSAAAGNLVTTPADLATAYMNGSPQLPASLTLAGINPYDPNNRYVRRDFPTGINSKTAGTGLKFAYTLPNEATLMSISSYEHYTANDYRDQDFVDVPTIARPGETTFSVGNNQFGTYEINSKTEELRLVSPDAGNFRYLAGLWWAKNTIDRLHGQLAVQPDQLLHRHLQHQQGGVRPGHLGLPAHLDPGGRGPPQHRGIGLQLHPQLLHRPAGPRELQTGPGGRRPVLEQRQYGRGEHRQAEHPEAAHARPDGVRDDGHRPQGQGL